MPSVRKMTAEEAKTLVNKGKGKRKLTQAEYDQFIADFASGDYGEVQLEPGEHRLTVRNRLKAAAARRNLGIVFRRTQGDMLRFRLEATQKQGILGTIATAVTDAVASILPKEAEPAPETASAKKPGRKKQTEAAASMPKAAEPAPETASAKKPGRKKAGG